MTALFGRREPVADEERISVSAPVPAARFGGCSGCLATSASVRVVRLRSTEVRLCGRCAKDLVAGLGRR